ncbi:hypothetical protein EI555_019290, partial [Monodon monoceros]
MWRCISTMGWPFSSSTSTQRSLGCAFNGLTRAWSGGSNPRLKTLDSNTDQGDLAGTHDAPTRCVEYCPEVNVVVTGPWDQTVKLRHPRTPCNAVTFYQLIVDKVGSKVLMWELQNMGYVQQCRLKAKWQLSTCSQALRYRRSMSSRVKENNIEQIYPVNAISFNNIYGTFAIGGSDGFVNILGPVNKKRRRWFCRYPTSITPLVFSNDGTTLAIALLYMYKTTTWDILKMASSHLP